MKSRNDRVANEIGHAALGGGGLDLQLREQSAVEIDTEAPGAEPFRGGCQNVHINNLHQTNARVKRQDGERIGLHRARGGDTLPRNMSTEPPRQSESPSVQQCLAAWRRLRGLSQAAAAEVSGVSRNTISRVENGEDVHQSTLEALARAYGAPSVSALMMPPGVAPPAASGTLDVVGDEETVLVPVFRGVPVDFTPSDPAYVRMEAARLTWGPREALCYIILTDESCFPSGREGSLVAINLRERKPPSQRPVLVALPDGTRAIRYLVRDADAAWVEPINKAWGPPVPLEAGVTILGRVRAWLVEER